MKNNKGFAVTGILYSILVLFLILLLLILANLHSRRVLFDKQKQTVLNKIEAGLDIELVDDFSYSESIQEFVTPKDGIYQLEVWGSDKDDGTLGGYAKGEIELYQGIKLFIVIGNSGSPSSIRIDEYNVTTVILKATGGNGETGFAYKDANGDDDIDIEPLTSIQLIDGNNAPSIKSSKCQENDGCVRIRYLRGL